MRASLVRGLGAGLATAILALTATFIATPGAAEAADQWQGSVLADHANVRSAPNAAASIVQVLPQGTPVAVATWVTGEEVDPTNTTWAQIGDGQYVYSAVIHKNKPSGPPPLPAGAPSSGKWIDINVTQQLLTAYDGSTPVHVAVISSGRPQYPTPQGTFTVLSRVANATMTNAGLSWIQDSYTINNVLFTQYFTPFGAALHEAYWKTPESFGIPTSHGCVGMTHEEAQWVWNWATVGTPLFIHQ